MSRLVEKTKINLSYIISDDLRKTHSAIYMSRVKTLAQPRETKFIIPERRIPENKRVIVMNFKSP